MIISLYQVFPYVGRGAGLSDEGAIEVAYTWNALKYLLLPFVESRDWEFFETDISMVNAYPGLIVIAFALYALLHVKAPIIRITMFSGVTALLISLAHDLPFAKWAIAWIPLFDFFRFPALLRYFFLLSLIFCAGLGMKHFLENFVVGKMKLPLIAIVVWLVIILVFSLSGFDAPALGKFPESELKTFLGSFTFVGRVIVSCIWQIILLSTFAFILFKAKSSDLFFKRIFILAAIDLIVSVQGNILFTVADPVVDPIRTVKELKAITPPGWPLPQRSNMLNAKSEGTSILGIWRNVNVFTKNPAADAFTSFWLKDYEELERDTILNKIVLNNPPVYLSSHIYSFDDLEKHKRNGMIEKENLYSDDAPHTDHSPKGETDTIYFTEFGPNRFEVHCRTQGPGFATIMQSAYPGWRSWVNQKEVKWFKSNYLFMSVPIDQGESNIVFEYHNTPVKIGFILSFCFWVFTIFLLFLSPAVLRK